MSTTRHCALLQHSWAMSPCCGGAAALVMVWQRAHRTLAAPAGYSSSVRQPLHTIWACVGAAERMGEGRNSGGDQCDGARSMFVATEGVGGCINCTSQSSKNLPAALAGLQRSAAP